MRVPLSPNFAIVETEQTVFLTDRRSELRIWPEDVFEPFPNWGQPPAADHVERMAKAAMLRPAQREVVRKFCRSVPDTPSQPTEPKLRRIDP